MTKFRSSPLSYLGALVACTIMAFTTGCASGGYKLTRQYAGWMNSQNIILRVILYILTSIVFAVTLLIDMVVFNTLDFWEGRVSQGTFEFQDADKTYVAQHEIMPETGLKKSTIRVFDLAKNPIQEVVLVETPKHEIEMFVDGKLRTRVRGIKDIPVATIYDVNGHQVKEHLFTGSAPVVASAR